MSIKTFKQFVEEEGGGGAAPGAANAVGHGGVANPPTMRGSQKIVKRWKDNSKCKDLADPKCRTLR